MDERKTTFKVTLVCANKVNGSSRRFHFTVETKDEIAAFKKARSILNRETYKGWVVLENTAQEV